MRRRQYNASASFIHRAITDVLEEAPCLKVFGRKAESSCRQVDYDAFGIGNVVDGKTRLTVEIDDDAGSGVVTDDTRPVGQQGVLYAGRAAWNRAKHCKGTKPPRET